MLYLSNLEKMNLFRSLFNIPKKRKRFLGNAEGDFYAEYGACTSCGAPQAEAPDLIDHSEKEYSHCFFKKQPQTDDELDRAINALLVSCVSGIRYGGKDEKILKRLYEMGCAAECDYKPIGKYKVIIWDKVTFKFDGSLAEIVKIIQDALIAARPWINKSITNQAGDETTFWTFFYRWAGLLHGIIYRCHINHSGEVTIELAAENNTLPISIRGSAIELNSILQSEKQVSNVIWFDQDKKTYSSKEVK